MTLSDMRNPLLLRSFNIFVICSRISFLHGRQSESPMEGLLVLNSEMEGECGALSVGLSHRLQDGRLIFM